MRRRFEYKRKGLAIKERKRPIKLVSGSQSGVDRAVLYVAIERGVAYGGWCPKGGWAEDFHQPPGLLAKYPELKETPLADPAQRTAWNLRDADACMILVDAGGLSASRGTALAHDLARDLAERCGKPLLVVDPREPDAVPRAIAWLVRQRAAFGSILRLAIGGPRESEAPGIYRRAAAFVRGLLSEYPP